MGVEIIDHTGIVVKDLNKAVNFYRDILGLKYLYSAEEGGADVSAGVGVENARLKLAYLQAENGLIELIEYISPKRKMPQKSPNMHVAFRVSNIYEVYDELKKKGVTFNSSPIKTITEQGTGCIWVYFKDPDNNTLELIEPLFGKKISNR
jgi:catechol 2,3-dioxygenase-like lactoylglutathione lyase family enzyme